MKTAHFAIATLLSLMFPAAVTGQSDVHDSIAHAVLSQMTLRQKVHEMHGRGVAKFGIGIFVRRKARPVKAGGNRKLGIPPTVFLDGPRGVSLYRGTTAFPVTMARGASWDPALEQRVGIAIATEKLALGANYSGAVCMNLLRHPAWGRAQETYGEDPHHVGEMALALIRGIQGLGVQACAKHLAVNSMENNRFGGDFIVEESVLHEVYLPHFRKAAEAGVASMMSAYNRLNGEYCGQSRTLLTDILRHRWGFRGYVTSDWEHGLHDSKAGILAGLNVEMPSGKHYSVRKVKRLLNSGEITMADIDSLVLPILRTKFEFAQQRKGERPGKDVLACDSHRALAQEVAEQSAVLLKNAHATLPLDRNSIGSIAVIGSLADSRETGDHGSSQVFNADVVTPLAGIRAFLEGTAAKVLTPVAGDTASLTDICKTADAVVVVAGLTWHDEGEYIGRGGIRDSLDREKLNPIVKLKVLGRGGDRKHLNLHAHDIAAIKAAASVNEQVIVVLVAGSAIMVEEWHDEVAAILQTFYNGLEGGTALARILFGEVNPSGKLPFTVPADVAHLPPFSPFSPKVEYGRYHGYTLLDKEGNRPRFPFGFGLSYTDFTISYPSIGKDTFTSGDSVRVTVTVRNTGPMAGSEVLQLYVSCPDNGPESPVKLLRAFGKVRVLPGESVQAELSFPVQELARYDAQNGTWGTVPGEYSLMVGNSSADAPLRSTGFTVND